MTIITKGRRVNSIAEITEPGDYYMNPNGSQNDDRSLWFCLPIDDPTDRRGSYLHRISEPPWTFRECADGSIEVRASILTFEPPEHKVERWHGYLDEGHNWRQI